MKLNDILGVINAEDFKALDALQLKETYEEDEASLDKDRPFSKSEDELLMANTIENSLSYLDGIKYYRYFEVSKKNTKKKGGHYVRAGLEGLPPLPEGSIDMKRAADLIVGLNVKIYQNGKASSNQLGVGTEVLNGALRTKAELRGIGVKTGQTLDGGVFKSEIITVLREFLNDYIKETNNDLFSIGRTENWAELERLFQVRYDSVDIFDKLVAVHGEPLTLTPRSTSLDIQLSP